MLKSKRAMTRNLSAYKPSRVRKPNPDPLDLGGLPHVIQVQRSGKWRSVLLYDTRLLAEAGLDRIKKRATRALWPTRIRPWMGEKISAKIVSDAKVLAPVGSLVAVA